MTFSEETLMAYADGELDPQTRTAVETAMTTDPELTRRIAQHEALRGKLRAAFDPVLDETPPERLIAAARGTPAVRREGNVIPLRRKPGASRWSLPQWGAIAASLFVGVLGGQALLRSANTGPITTRNGQLLATGVLAHSLSEQLASNQTPEAPVHIGVSFKSKTGDYCRTFVLHDSGTVAGLACREQQDWRVQVLAQTEAVAQNNGQLRPAASALPRSVLQAVEDTIAGDPLDASTEAAARDKEWHH